MAGHHHWLTESEVKKGRLTLESAETFDLRLKQQHQRWIEWRWFAFTCTRCEMQSVVSLSGIGQERRGGEWRDDGRNCHGYYYTFHDNYNCDEVSIMAETKINGDYYFFILNWTVEQGRGNVLKLRAGNWWKLTCKFNKLADRNYVKWSALWYVHSERRKVQQSSMGNG